MDKPLLGWTTIEQSEKLTGAGLDPDTADMCRLLTNQVLAVPYKECATSDTTPTSPCWSLGALMNIVQEAFKDSPGGYELYSSFTSERNSNADIRNVAGSCPSQWRGWTEPVAMWVEIAVWCLEHNYIKRKRAKTDTENESGEGNPYVMVQEDKDLLIKCLCAILPYGVMVRVEHPEPLPDHEHISEGFLGGYALHPERCQDFTIDEILEALDSGCIVKPYLYPMEIIWEGDVREIYERAEPYIYESARHSRDSLHPDRKAELRNDFLSDAVIVDELTKRRFDYWGLIPKALALPAPDGMYA